MTKEFEIRVDRRIKVLADEPPARPPLYIKAGTDRDAAVKMYDEVRAKTYKQQVTLYTPSGKRLREAWGTATGDAE